MPRSRNFSIYLLKCEYTPLNALKDNHGLELLNDVDSYLPVGSRMYVSERMRTTPWWKNYWNINVDIFQESRGALVFIPVNGRWVVMTFGTTFHYLKGNAYEYDFGIRTALNMLDSEKIKSTDILQPESARRQRIQVPTASNLTFFDFNKDESIIKRLTGSVREDYSLLAKGITGASSLRLSSKVQPREIVSMCQQILTIYQRDDYREMFPDVHNIVPIKDPDLIDSLDRILLTAFQESEENLILTIPEILNYDDAFGIKYGGAGRWNHNFEDIHINDYREYLSNKEVNVNSVEFFHRHYLSVVDDNNNEKAQYIIYRCFLLDCDFEGRSYHLCDGEWYSINSDYLERLQLELDEFFDNDIGFLPICNYRKEGDYNLHASNNTTILCLDCANIAPEGETQVEPCDLITEYEEKACLIHIKISTISANLSHLFNQGLNSVELLRLNNEARNKLKLLIDDNERLSTHIENQAFCIIYGIITSKNRDNKSRNLPLFSRISLLRSIRTLQLMNIPCKICFIEDAIDR